MPRYRQLVEKSDGLGPWYSREHEGVLTHPAKVQNVSLTAWDTGYWHVAGTAARWARGCPATCAYRPRPFGLGAACRVASSPCALTTIPGGKPRSGAAAIAPAPTVVRCPRSSGLAWHSTSRQHFGRPYPTSVRVHQYAYFALRSERLSAQEMTARVGLEPDRVMVRGSRMPEIPIPRAHGWEVTCPLSASPLDEQGLLAP
ncbi:DUF4279 domain-containing protein [Micromonospora sp. NPDC005298]|uniref:DUF4279 domain-containing protein n=1 Tax=Micromonospora sp. NPDC005298 TaxID=3156873 RepID=UPI0033B2C20F